MKTKTENKSRSKMRKRETVTLEFMWKIYEEIKNHAIDKKFHYKEQAMCTRI